MFLLMISENTVPRLELRNQFVVSQPIKLPWGNSSHPVTWRGFISKAFWDHLCFWHSYWTLFRRIYAETITFAHQHTNGAIMLIFSFQCRRLLQKSDKGQIFYWSSQTALGSPVCLFVCSIVTMLKNLKTALFQTFSTWHPNTFCPYCIILT